MKLRKKLSVLLLTSSTALAAAACETCEGHHSGTATPDALIVIRDADTGKLRAPTAAEGRALRDASPATPARSAQTHRQTEGGRSASTPLLRAYPSGARSARLPPELTTFSVVTRSQDGSIASHCVDGHEAASNLLQRSLKLQQSIPAARETE